MLISGECSEKIMTLPGAICTEDSKIHSRIHDVILCRWAIFHKLGNSPRNLRYIK